MIVDPIFKGYERVFCRGDDLFALMGAPGMTVEEVFKRLPHLTCFGSIAVEERDAFCRAQQPADDTCDDTTADGAAFQYIKRSECRGIGVDGGQLFAEGGSRVSVVEFVYIP